MPFVNGRRVREPIGSTGSSGSRITHGSPTESHTGSRQDQRSESSHESSNSGLLFNLDDIESEVSSYILKLRSRD